MNIWKKRRMILKKANNTIVAKCQLIQNQWKKGSVQKRRKINMKWQNFTKKQLAQMTHNPFVSAIRLIARYGFNMQANEAPRGKPRGILKALHNLTGASFDRKFIIPSGLIPNTLMV